MLAAQGLYGPHASDQWDTEWISIGRRLYRLLPEDWFDEQPLIGGGGHLTLVGDLRLDNREEIEEALGLIPDGARRMCDAAILLAAWERWADGCFERLVGEYAFAIWDAAKRALVLARDPFGQRPLHFHRGARFFAFSSMPKGLHTLSDVPRCPDAEHCVDLLMGMPQIGSRSFFAGIERVEPGCALTVVKGAIRTERHWRPQRRPVRLKTNDDYVAAMREQLDQAVRSRLRRFEGGVGAHLSAGLDSPAVAATAARMLAPSGERLVAFTAAPAEGYAGTAESGLFTDEGPLAAATAAMHANIEHVIVRSTHRLPTDDLDRDFYLYDRPMPNRCNHVWWHEINRQARDRGLVVMLTAGRGNLTFSCDGLDALPNAVRERDVRGWWRIARSAVAAGTLHWKGVLFHSLGPWMPEALWRALNRLRGGPLNNPLRGMALNPDLTAPRSRNRRLREIGWDPLGRYGSDSFGEGFAHLSSIDSGNARSARLAGWGIDERDPTCDRRLVEFSLNMPPEQFMAGGALRTLARRTLADRVPRVVLDEPLKALQAADWHVAMTAGRDDLAAQVSRLGENPIAASVLDVPRLRSLVEHWPSEGWERSEVYQPYRGALLNSLSVGHFLIRASGSNQ